MSSEEQRRSWVIARLAAGELGVTEAARALSLFPDRASRIRQCLDAVQAAMEDEPRVAAPRQ